MIRTRFAPSPTGPLHLGHAYSAILAHDFAVQNGGEFVVRIEDLDQSRARPAWKAQILDDLSWLGLTWSRPVLRQSERSTAYDAAIQTLKERDLIYPCVCTRRDISEAASAPQEGAMPLVGPDGIVYPGLCKNVNSNLGRHPAHAIRLHMERAFECAAVVGPIEYCEMGPLGNTEVRHLIEKSHALEKIGDIVISRRDMAAAYHLAVVVDDAAQGITHVVRGNDLKDATDIHVVLQRCLGLSTPIYLHHDLIRDDAGKRLAKRDDARALSKYRAEGATPADIRRMVGL